MGSLTTIRETSRQQAHYDASYGDFRAALYAEIRRDAFGEDIGQQSWITAAEQDGFIRRLNLGPGKALLDIASGAGGPALQDRRGHGLRRDRHRRARPGGRDGTSARGGARARTSGRGSSARTRSNRCPSPMIASTR